MAGESIGVWIGNDLDVDRQLRWALRLAQARQLDLVVFEHVQSNECTAHEVPLNEPVNDGASPLIDAIQKLIQSSDHLSAGVEEGDDTVSSENDDVQRTTIRLKNILSATPREFRELMIDEVREDKLKTLTLMRREHDSKDPELVRERQLFLRYAPCEVVFCFGLPEEKEYLQIAVGVASGTHGSAAIQFAHDISKAPDVSLTAARVNPDIGPDSIRVGARRLDALLGRSLGTDTEGVLRKVVVNNSCHKGIQQFWEDSDYDLIVMGASRVGLWGSRIIGSTGSKLYKLDKERAVIVVSAGAPITGRFAGAMEGKFERLVPQIDRDNRVALVERLQSNSNWDFDFFALMVLATTIAAIGLVQNSAAVVIGAMLVAPLMTPLLGLGLALVQGNAMLAKISVRSVSFGICVALLVGVLVGLVIPGFDQATPEMLARGGPSLLDLFVAFASGLAAAYASSRPGLLAALPGVAIAAALVPPIATSGLALSQGNWDLALHALLLFVVNMFTIVLASIISLWMVGFRSFQRTPEWIIYSGVTVMVGVLALGIFLSLSPEKHALTKDLPPDLVESVQSHLGKEFHVEGIEVVYEDFDIQLNLHISGDRLVPEDLAEDVRMKTRELFDQAVQVRLITRTESAVMSVRESGDSLDSGK